MRALDLQSPMAKASARKSPVGVLRGRKPARKTTSGPRIELDLQTSIPACQDDSFAGSPHVKWSVPERVATRIGLLLKGTRPGPARYGEGSKECRSWTAVDAIARGAESLRKMSSPASRWQTLPVSLDEGVDPSSYYVRRTLSFFHGAVSKVTAYIGTSPDVVLDEMGTASLDILCDELSATEAVEAAALNEFFGDITAVLVGRQSPSLSRAAFGPKSASTQRLRLYE